MSNFASLPSGEGLLPATRVTVFVGHFGSGKSEIAANTALALAGAGHAVTLVDLDVVKPYFRTRQARAFLAKHGVPVVAPEGENIHADLPIVLPEIRRLLRDGATRLLLDAGGDPVGARVLGSLADVIPPAETAQLLVLNFRRPITETVDDAVAMVRAIESVARLPVRGLVSNTHLMHETTPEVVRDGLARARLVGERLGLPVVAVVAEKSMAPSLGPLGLGCPVVAIRRLIEPPFGAVGQRWKVGPLFLTH
jgi:hypothetical protein